MSGHTLAGIQPLTQQDYYESESGPFVRAESSQAAFLHFSFGALSFHMTQCVPDIRPDGIFCQAVACHEHICSSWSMAIVCHIDLQINHMFFL